MTTPQELASIVHKATQGIEPYQTAVVEVLDFAGQADYWPYGALDGRQDCQQTWEPKALGRGSPLIYAQAMASHLTRNSHYAEAVRQRLLDITDTYDYGGEEYSGANQCILNLSWYLPGWIMAADLIEDYPGWRTQDKREFQRWLADEIYKKTAWASRHRNNNWGAAASATSSMIADYLWDAPYPLEGASPAEAYLEHKQRQLDRMNGVWRGDSKCPIWGIQPYGGIPDELRRGDSGCRAQWLVEADASWTYTQTHLEGLVTHAELLLRRGDNAIYENVSNNSGGSLLKAIHFVINNPIKPSQSLDFKDNHKPLLEVTYRYYQDAPTAQQLKIGSSTRFIGGRSGQMLHFGTITHGFASDENPAAPPTVPPPA